MHYCLAAVLICPSFTLVGNDFFCVEKTHSLHPCIDYQGVTDIPIKNKYPLHLTDSAFEPLYQATPFSKLGQNAYHLIHIMDGVK